MKYLLTLNDVSTNLDNLKYIYITIVMVKISNLIIIETLRIEKKTN